MQPETVRRLLEINRTFYTAFALPFSVTRKRLQPGVLKILERISSESHILDLGCGNGELWRRLLRSNFQGVYIGLDLSAPLLDVAQSEQAELTAGSENRPIPFFHQADLASDSWQDVLPDSLLPIDFTLAFAVLHHLPGEEIRMKTIHAVRKLLAPGDLFVHSNWQFLNSERLRTHIQPWDRVEIEANEVDEGDYLLDWRSGGSGLRYAHHFDEGELTDLAGRCGFQVVESFLSDGEGNQLGLYQIWQAE